MNCRSLFLATTILIGKKSSTSCLIVRHLDEKSRDCVHARVCMAKSYRVYIRIYMLYIYAYIVRVHVHRNTFHPTVIKFTYTFLAANKTQLQHSANLLRLAEYPKTSFVMRRQSPSRVLPSLVCNHWPICIIFPTALETCAIILEKRWFHKFG